MLVFFSPYLGKQFSLPSVGESKSEGAISPSPSLSHQGRGNSLFITFEGGEGCGKSIQSRALCRWLSKLAIPALLIHEPGGTPLGEKVRRLLKRGNFETSPLAELLLFNTSRSQLVTSIIQPNLRQGKVVICDRFADSTVAYQGYGRGLDLGVVREVNRIAAQGLTPDLTILLDVPVGVGLVRKSGNSPDRFEREDIAFHQRVRDGFLKLAAQEPKRFLLIDSTLPKENIASIIRQRVSQLLKKKA